MARLVNENTMSIKARLSHAQMDTFRFFLDTLNNLTGQGFCTIMAHYEICMKKDTIRRTDGASEWDGFNKLTECLCQ